MVSGDHVHLIDYDHARREVGVLCIANTDVARDVVTDTPEYDNPLHGILLKPAPSGLGVPTRDPEGDFARFHGYGTPAKD